MPSPPDAFRPAPEAAANPSLSYRPSREVKVYRCHLSLRVQEDAFGPGSRILLCEES